MVDFTFALYDGLEKIETRVIDLSESDFLIGAVMMCIVSSKSLNTDEIFDYFSGSNKLLSVSKEASPNGGRVFSCGENPHVTAQVPY